MGHRIIPEEELAEILRKHGLWLRGEPGGVRDDLRGADLRWADLSGANLRDADLSGANLDYTCWPLWCGSLGVKVDKRIAAQIAYHFCQLGCEDPDYIRARNAILDFANTFHRVKECGELKPLPEPPKEY